MRDFDVVVIGSGSGGLSAAVALANAGKRVGVFEQHYLPGGYSQSFQLNGYRFSPGIHYIGQLGPGQRLRRIYEGLGVADDLIFFELDPDGYDRVVVGDEHFSIPKGVDRFRARLHERFPTETKGIDGYLDLVVRLGDELGWARPPRSVVEALLLPWRMRTTLRHGTTSLAHTLDRFTRDPLLRAILSIQAGDHGMAPARASMALHAGLQTYYFDGACYPRGGGHAIPDALIQRLRRQGGEIYLRSEVTRILVRDHKAVGIRLADGREIASPAVISNTDPGVTWGQLVEPEHVPARLLRRLQRLRYSISTVSLFLAVDMDLRAAGLDSGNIWYSRTPDIDACYRIAESADLKSLDPIPGMFFNVTTLKDPTLRRDGIHTIEALVLASPDAFARWRESDPEHRPEEYRVEKEWLAQRILDAIETFVPGLRERVVFHAVGTPLTNIHYLHATRGGIYGTEKTLGNLGPFSFAVRSPVPGLFLCGASTLSPGIHGVTTSGLAAAGAVLECSEEELLNARSGPLQVYAAEDPSTWPTTWPEPPRMPWRD